VHKAVETEIDSGDIWRLAQLKHRSLSANFVWSIKIKLHLTCKRWTI